MREPGSAHGETSALASAHELYRNAATPIILEAGAEGATLPRSVSANEEAAKTEPSRIEIDPGEFVGFLP
jgi:plastocyanin